ncbi:hypothetical protein DYH09_12455 [bacterium CPR1]|nr:hypothetical protein [bacterium CPR1]
MLRAMLFLALVLGAPALAEVQDIVGNHQTETVTLAGEDKIQIMGNHNVVKAVGQSVEAGVVLMGNHNTVTLVSTGGATDLLGNHNTVVVDGDWSAINVLGNYNTVKIVRKKGRPEPMINRVGKNTQVLYVDP